MRELTHTLGKSHLRVYVLDLLRLVGDGRREHLVERRDLAHAALDARHVRAPAQQHLLQRRVLCIRHGLHLLLLLLLPLTLAVPDAGARGAACC